MNDFSYNHEAHQMFLKAFSNKTRFNILLLIGENGPMDVNTISKSLDIEQSRTSHNLKCLIDCKFLERKKHGKNNIYYLNEKSKRLLEKIQEYVSEYEEYLRECKIIR